MSSLSKKIVLLGNFHVGKTSLINRFVSNRFFADYHTTLGVKIQKKVVQLSDNISINMIIWDIAGGQLKYKVPISYYLGSSALIYVIDATRPEQMDQAKMELDSLKKKYKDAAFVLVANKADLLSDNEKGLMQSQFDEINFFTSAKTGKNVELMFQYVAEQIYATA